MSGPGEQTLTWEADAGEWAVVVMNADASPGVSVDAELAVRTGLLLPVGIGLLVAGLLAAAVAAVLLVVGLRRAPDDELAALWRRSQSLGE